MQMLKYAELCKMPENGRKASLRARTLAKGTVRRVKNQPFEPLTNKAERLSSGGWAN